MNLLLLACTGPSVDPGETGVSDTSSPIVQDGPAWPGADWDEGAPEDHGLDPDVLEELREYAFRDAHATQGVVVIKDGVLVAEWYADGTDASTPTTSWSAAKSVTSALIGAGIRDGLVDLDQSVGDFVPEWSEGGNEVITVRHLLEMRSGLPENTTLQYGVYAAEDALAYSLDRELVREPGTQWSYVNEDSQILGEVIHQAFGKPSVDVAQEQIFGPIGMDAIWWTDGDNNALTYCCIDSTARDMARFGLLYSRGGEWDGQQLIPADYVDLSTSGVAYYGYYGLHWWVFDEDLFAAIGLHGQYIYVWPTEDMVVVRMGEYTRSGDGYERTGNNYHQTVEPQGWDNEVFVPLFQSAVVDD